MPIVPRRRQWSVLRDDAVRVCVPRQRQAYGKGQGHPMTFALIIAWAFGTVAIGLVWRHIRDIEIDTIDAPVPLALYRARCDEVARLQQRVKRLEAELAAVESNP